MAKEKVPDIFKVTNHTLTPHGPGGQHGTAIPFNYGVWKFAKEKELAKQFLQYMMEPKRYEEIFHATLTFNAPPFKNGEQFDWERDPKTAMLKDYAKTAHMIGWPAPPDRKAEQVRAEWIVPNMFTYYALGESLWTKPYPGVRPNCGGSTQPRRKWLFGVMTHLMRSREARNCYESHR